MPINKESLQRRLEKALGRYDPKAVDDNDEVIPLADEADAFRFNFTKDGEDYGRVYVTLDDTNSLTVWFDDKVMDSPDGKTPGLDYDDTWFGFLQFMKRWAMNNQLSFKTDNRQHLGNEMARRKRMKEKEKISEGYHAMGKKQSYNDAIPNVKIVLQHSRVMQEGEQRFRNIEKIFVENQNGERFLVPTTKPGIARVFARHIAEGGTPYDERATHLQSLVEEYTKMAGFVRATRNGQFNESAQQLVQEGVNHYLSLRESLGKLTGHRGYTAYFESWTPPLMEDEADTSALNELFVQETMDPRIESVMPILSRLHKQVAEMKEVDELSEWAESLLSEKMVMGADTDASSGGTVNAYIEEEESLTSNNPVGIPEEIENNPVINAITRRILSQHLDLVKKHGPEKLAQAIDSVGDFVGDVDEIGTSDVSGWVKQVERELDSQVDEGIADDYEDMSDREIMRHARMLGLEKNIVPDEEGGLANRREMIYLLQQEAGEDLEESGLQAYLGNKKYGKEGMDALRKAGREHAGKEKMAKIRAKYDKLDEEDEFAGDFKTGPAGQWRNTGPKKNKPATVGDLVGASESFINTDAQAVVTEMDSEGYKGTRDDYEIGKGKEGKAKLVKPGEVVKKGVKALDKAMDKAHPDYDNHEKKLISKMSNAEKADKGWRNPNVKEGQEDLDAILRIIKK